MEHLNFESMELVQLNLLKRLTANSHGRDFVVGDLKGCRAMFDRLLEDVGFDKAADRMFCTGGLANYGPDPIGCLNLLNEPWFHSVAGHHEQLLLSAAMGTSHALREMVANGGTWATMIESDDLVELASRVSNLPLAIAVGDGAERFNVIHAEFHGPDEALEDQLEDITNFTPVPLSLTRGRALITGKTSPKEHAGLSTTFCGHTVVREASSLGSHIFMETGAYIAEREGAGSNHAMTIIEPETALHWRSRPVV
jgi:serine/threonine protein phosphatase 1